jgi:hypothetical protein
MPVLYLIGLTFLVAVTYISISFISAQASLQNQDVIITSPIDGGEVKVGQDILVSGTSTDDSTRNCLVSIRSGNEGEYTLATPDVPGSDDYSRWSHTIPISEAGPHKISAKFSCSIDPASTSFDTVNVIAKDESNDNNNADGNGDDGNGDDGNGDAGNSADPNPGRGQTEPSAPDGGSNPQ